MIARAHGARRVAGALFSLSAVCVLSLSLADGPPRVVLVGPSAEDGTVVRYQKELGILGFAIDFVPSAQEGRLDLAELARDHHAQAVLVVELAPPAAVLWIDPSRLPNGVAGPQIRVDEKATGSAEHRLLVLRAVEILRERVLASPSPSGPDASVSVDADTPARSLDASPSDAAPPRAPAEQRPGASAFLGAGVLASPGGPSVMPPIFLGARWAPTERLDLELVALVPTASADVGAPEGTIAVRAGGFGAGAAAKLGEPAGRFFASLGGGLGAMFTSFEGQARAPWVSASGLRAGVLPYAHVAAGFWLTPAFALRGDALAAVTLPEPVLVIAGRRVGVFGEPALVFAAALEVRP